MSNVILVVDGNAARRDAVVNLLKAHRLVAVPVKDGAEAVEIVQTIKGLRLVITELSLPRVDGFQLLRCLQEGPSAGAPALVLSAFREMRQVAAARRSELGIRGILSTSASPHAIMRMVTALLEEPKTPRDARHARESWDASIDVAPVGEAERLASMDAAGATDESADDSALREIVRRVASRFDVPVALVSLVLANRQWFKARVGTHLVETALDVSFCRHVVAARDTMIVPDATIHPNFSQNHLVQTNIVRGYAGAPLVGSDGHVWGSLCIIDPHYPLDITGDDAQHLTRFASEVVREIEKSARHVLASHLRSTEIVHHRKPSTPPSPM